MPTPLLLPLLSSHAHLQAVLHTPHPYPLLFHHPQIKNSSPKALSSNVDFYWRLWEVTEEGVPHKVKCPFNISALPPSSVSTTAGALNPLLLPPCQVCSGSTHSLAAPSSTCVQVYIQQNKTQPQAMPWLLGSLVQRATCVFKNLEQKGMSFFSFFPLLDDIRPSISAILSFPNCLWPTEIFHQGPLQNAPSSGNLSIISLSRGDFSLP